MFSRSASNPGGCVVDAVVVMKRALEPVAVLLLAAPLLLYSAFHPTAVRSKPDSHVIVSSCVVKSACESMPVLL